MTFKVLTLLSLMSISMWGFGNTQATKDFSKQEVVTNSKSSTMQTPDDNQTEEKKECTIRIKIKNKKQLKDSEIIITIEGKDCTELIRDIIKN